MKMVSILLQKYCCKCFKNALKFENNSLVSFNFFKKFKNIRTIDTYFKKYL